MRYIQAEGATFTRHISADANVAWDATHYCQAEKLTAPEAAQFGVHPLALVTPPPFDRIEQGLRESMPVLVNGAWTQQWEVFPLPAEESAANRTNAERSRIASLWQAAHDVEYAAISGSAIGLITIGILQGKPKCMAVQAWIQALWAEYYRRKASASADTGFSAFANCPHSVPELMQELGLA